MSHLKKIRIVKKKVIADSYRELKKYERYLRDNPDTKELFQSRLNSFYALESLVIFKADLENETIKRQLCKSKKS